MSESSIPQHRDNTQDDYEWLPLDTARGAFAAMVAGPDPLALDGDEFPGFPARTVPLDEVRDRLLDRRCPVATRDAVWRHLLGRARRDGATWMVACVGVALPGLAASARWLAARYRGERVDIHAAVLTGFVEALATVDTRDPGVWTRLLWQARRAGHAALAESLNAPIPSITVFESRAPRVPYGHSDLVLARAVGDGVLTPTEAELISATRLGDETVTGWASNHDRSVHAVAKARERAEHRLRAYLTDPDYPHADGPDSDDPVADAVMHRIQPVAHSSADAGPDSCSTANKSLAVSGRRRNGRAAELAQGKKTSRSVSKNTSKSGLLPRGESTPSTPRPATSEPISEVRRCA